MLEKPLPWTLCWMIFPPQTWPLAENLHLAKAAILMPIPTATSIIQLLKAGRGYEETKRKNIFKISKTSMSHHL